MEDFDTEMEKCTIKCQWEVNKEEKIAEQKKAMEEASEEAEKSKEVDDKVTESLDLRNLRATEFKNNKRVILPQPGDDKEEIRRNNLKSELRKVVVKYRNENCDTFGNLLDNNINETQQKNLKNLKSRIKQEGLVCSQTDKTGKLTLDTVDNVVKKMDKHIQNDKIINEKQVRALENRLNSHTEWWIKILQPGKDNFQMKRVKGNLVTKDNQIPVLRGTSKDHKKALDRKIGPDLRPIMGANVGPNTGLSEIGSMIVRKIAETCDTGLVSKSTEEVLNKIEEFNKTRSGRKLRKIIIASMDIEKCYPNILSKESAGIIRKMWEESELEILEIEADHLCRYLGKYLKPNEVVEEGFEHLVYTKKIKKKKASKKISRKHVKSSKVKKNGQDIIKNNKPIADTSNSEGADTQKATTKEDREVMDTNTVEGEDTLTAVEDKKKTTDKKKKKTEDWIKPRRKPTQKEERKLFGKALEIMLIACMDNHVYQFNNEIRVQKKGGPIGLKLTGEIFDCIMIDWDKRLLCELEKLKVVPELYTRFKDDIEIATESLERGSQLSNNEIVVDDTKKEVDIEKSDTKVTMEVIQEVANSINPMIKLTVDTPCNYPDGKLPVLDVAVNVNENEDNRIDFEFFEKPTKNPMVILASSALSQSQKRTILTQECLRRLRNTKIELGPEVQTKHLNLFMLKLKNSGYKEKFRKEILNSALQAFAKMLADDESGAKPMYRSRNWNFEERKKSKLNKKHNWWNSDKSKIQYRSVLFVTPTPGGVLAAELRKREADLNKNSVERIKIVEKGGLKIKDILCSKNQMQKLTCKQKTCPMCKQSKYVEANTDKNQLPCSTNNVGYRWRCMKCQENDKVNVYEGESGRSARIRGAEHVRDLEKNRETSALYKHAKNDHNGEEVKFKMEITKKFRDALTRQANEAVRIYSRPGHELLNSKSEFNHPPMARVVVQKKTSWAVTKSRKQTFKDVS